MTLEQQYVSYDQGPTFYNTMIQGDNLPDLGFLFMGMIPEYAERGVLEPLDAFMTAAERQAWIDVALSAGEYQGKDLRGAAGGGQPDALRAPRLDAGGSRRSSDDVGRGPRAGECAQPAARALWILYRRWPAETPNAGSDRNDVGVLGPTSSTGRASWRSTAPKPSPMSSS